MTGGKVKTMKEFHTKLKDVWQRSVDQVVTVAQSAAEITPTLQK